MDSAPRVDLDWPNAAALVLSTDSPRQERWAVNAAIEVVRKLAGQHPKVVLADLQKQTPSPLGAALGVEEQQGIADVLFRGASFSAVAKRPEGESFFFLTLGSSPPERDVLYQHPRWPKIASRLAETGAHLLVCVSADEWLEAGPIAGFESCIVVNASGLEVELPNEAGRLAELLAPPAIRDESEGKPVAGAEIPSEEPWVSEDTLGEEDDAGEPEVPEEALESTEGRSTGDMATGGVWEAPTVSEEEGPFPGRASAYDASEDYAAPPPFADEPAAPLRYEISERDGFLARLWQRRVLIPVIAVSAAAVLAFFLWGRGGGEYEPGAVDRMQAAAEIDQSPPAVPSGERGAVGDEPLDEEGEEPEAVEPDAEVTGGEVPRADEVALPYSVLIASFSSIDDALQRARGWGRGQDVLFYVAPTPVRGVVYYRVLAGILAERGRAAELMADLVRDGIKEQASDWDIRPVRLAFSFGTYPSRRDAEAVVETLASHGVPAYIVPTLAADGAGEGYRVLAGGYEDPDDAGPLREQIERAELPGVDVELVERVGLVER